ncbi:hypothetical protein FB451DRAFT_1494313 [Mycena latifolia]|nr:hypothetical protein FB451DRAFT_1494313 [Mycena latifolia]
MAARSAPHASVSSPSDQRAEPGFAPMMRSHSSDSDWLAPLILSAKIISAGTESIPFPYVRSVFGTAVFLLETVEKVQKNRDRMKELCIDTVDIMTVIRDRISFHRDTAALQFKVQCEKFESFLQNVVEAVHQRQMKPRGFSARVKEVVNSSRTSEEINRFRERIREVRSNFMLMTTMDTNFGVQKVLTMMSPSVPVPEELQLFNNCPPPTRIFHGRRTILDKIQQYFSQSQGEQDICLLHGLGGAGKTQIALKFIEESASQFTNIFLIDTSTVDTIDAGLKNIAATTSVGDSAKNALQWLESRQDEWLLFFDNADDPKINLNNYFPQCSHGNILITSRNPGLCVYAGVHFTVSDMEEMDAVDLLLRSAAQDSTDDTKEAAAHIVKVLYYLPLAIIQAGAFISKSGNLHTYLALYECSKAQLLGRRLDQLHDNYVWTVYTTWQISFEQLSQEAKVFFQLCSFLHYQGISEDIFKHATNFKFQPSSPSKEELELPLKVVSHFVRPSGEWDPLCFLDVITEIRAYSLINVDSKRNLFSIHPLVHEWTRSTVSNEAHRQCMIAITGMSLTESSEEAITLASPWMLPHIDALMGDNLQPIPDFRHEYAKVYLCAGRLDKAETLLTMVFKQRRKVLGEDHPATLECMFWLAWTYEKQGKLKEAQELGVVVLKKRSDVLGHDHLDTLEAMGNLALTYHKLGRCQEAEEYGVLLLQRQKNHLDNTHLGSLRAMGNVALVFESLGKLREAEKLELVVLEKRRTVLGDSHPSTLIAMGHLAFTYSLLRKSQEAEELGLRVLEKQRNILGDNHIETLKAVRNLGFIYYKLGQWPGAEDLLLRVLEKQRNILGDNHPDTLNVMGCLGATYSKLGKLQAAAELEMVVLKQRRKILSDSHPATLLTMGNLAVTYKKLGRLQEAQELLVVALKKQMDILGDNHPSTLCNMSRLGCIFNELERWKEAEELLVAALKKQANFLEKNHPDTLETMQNLAVTYTRQGKLKAAEDLDKTLKRSSA